MLNFPLNWTVLPTSEFPLWDDWVNSREMGSWFHTLRAFNLVHQSQPEILILKDLSGKWIAGFPFVRAKKFGMVYPKRNALLYFSSPIIHEDFLSDFDTIIDSLNRNFSFAVYDFPYQKKSYRSFAKSGTEQFGFWLDIERDDETQIEKMSSSHQKTVKRKLLGLLEVKPTREINIQDLELAHLSYRDHQKKSPFDLEVMNHVFKNLQPSESVVIQYSSEGETLGWRCYVKDKKGFWIDWLAGTKRGVTKERFGQQLIFRAVQEARLENASGINLTGANTPGIAEFKEKFGSVKTYGLHIRYVKNTFIKWMVRFREFFI